MKENHCYGGGSLDEHERELELLLAEASRLACYDLTLENGRARAKFDALGPRERELRELIARKTAKAPRARR